MILYRTNIIKLFSSFSKSNRSSKEKVQNSFQTFASDLRNHKDVYGQYKKQVQKDTILNKFRRDVFKKQQISEQVKAYKEDLQKQQFMMENLLNKGSKQDVIKYSKKIMEKLVNKKKIFKDQTINTVFSDYGDYSSYRSNFVKIEDGNLGDLQRLDRANHITKLYKFIDDLPDQFQQKKLIRDQISEDFQHSNQNMSIEDYGKFIQQRHNAEHHFTQKKIQLYQTYDQTRQRKFQTLGEFYLAKLQATDRMTDLSNRQNFRASTLSPNAMNTIYQCYLQGWTIRDISKRFGILPRRTKFCIWARAQLYDQLLPKYGWKYYYEALQNELQFGSQHGYIDYGLDLDMIQSQRLPEEILQWTPNRVDSQRKQQQYTLALEKLEKMKKFDKHQKVQVGTHGKENKMYLLKEWTIFRGKGSDEYHLKRTTFRKLEKDKKHMVKEYY